MSGELLNRPDIDKVRVGTEDRRWDLVLVEDARRLYRRESWAVDLIDQVVRGQDERAVGPGQGAAQTALGHDTEGLSSQSRLEKIVADILLDFETRDRLNSGDGNTQLVSGSLYSASRFFEMFERTDLAVKCAIITSYKPSPADIKGEETGEGLTRRCVESCQQLVHHDQQVGKSATIKRLVPSGASTHWTVVSGSRDPLKATCCIRHHEFFYCPRAPAAPG